MSRSTRRSRRLAKERWHAQAAVIVAACETGHSWQIRPASESSSGEEIVSLADDIVDGATFDVARVRAHCKAVLADAERLAEERIVFTDWTREQGLGPENHERGAFILQLCEECGSAFEPGCRRCDGVGHPRGGWPGPLARAWAKSDPAHRHARAASGPGIARTAKRLLDALDGRCAWNPEAKAQPSECPRCRGEGEEPSAWLGDRVIQAHKCSKCGGTGHNLAGCLPPLVDDIATIAAVADAWEVHRALTSWQQDVRTRNRDEMHALRSAANAQSLARAERRRLYRALLRQWRSPESEGANVRKS